MNITIFIAHEVEVGGGHRHRFSANAKEAANINNDLTAVDMIDRTYCLVILAVNRGALQDVGRQFSGCQANVVSMVHLDASSRLDILNNRSRKAFRRNFA
ncbi:MAG: hypothetical protein BGO03_14365 [Mesorhizobium sp. 61-13]|nr:MAG: hypothetical protein BGO03_14365 [Mesorhizobium sp. 61-13]